MALTDTQIRNAKAKTKPYKLTDAKGLYLEVRPTGAKLWRYRYRIEGKENVFAIGEYFNDQRPGHISLDQARQERGRARELVKEGRHPAHERHIKKAEQTAENANTFEGIAREWIARNAKKWSEGYAKQVKYIMERDVFPEIGKQPIRTVTAAQILGIMRKVESRGAVIFAINVRQWCSAVFAYAVSTLRADGDPTVALRRAIERPATKHKATLSEKDIPQYLDRLQGGHFFPTSRIALHLLLLLWVRPSELRKAEWREFDIDGGMWTIPAEKMKNRKPHVVPLSTQSIALLEQLKPMTGGGRYLFPNARRPEACMNETALNQALRRMGYEGVFSAHGFRGTASTILNGMGFNRDVIERQLSHTERDRTRASYNHHDYLPERRAMMQQWADLIGQLASGGKVIPGKFGKAA
jgi:integrase